MIASYLHLEFSHLVNLSILDKHLAKRNEGDEDYDENSDMDKQQWENEQKVVKMLLCESNYVSQMLYGNKPDQ